MRYFDPAQVCSLLDMASCIPLMGATLADYSAGRTVQVLRTAMAIEDGKILGVMPAANPAVGIAGTKIITVFPQNFKRGLPSHQGVVVLFETETGALEALLDGEAITGIRTAAVSAAATDALARKDAHVLCILGSGLQARRHLEAMTLVRDITQVRVWDVDRASAQTFAREMSDHYGIPVEECCGSVRDAVEGADIICTVTAAREPVLFGEHVSPGAHINAVGACGAGVRELDAEVMRRGRLFCDSLESARSEAGDYLIPLDQGLISAECLLGEVGKVISGELPGRTDAADITIFEAQGLAVEDLAAADHIVQKARKQEGEP